MSNLENKNNEVSVREGEEIVTGNMEGGATFALLFDEIRANNDEGVNSLLKSGANPNLKDNQGSAALHLSAKVGSPTITSLLLSHGADINIHNKMKNTPLDMAVRSAKLEVARMLLQKGANVNNQMESGWTSLHTAANENNQDMVHLLCQFNANLTLRASSRKIEPSGRKITPKEVAMKKGFESIVMILENKNKVNSSMLGIGGGSGENAKRNWTAVSDVLLVAGGSGENAKRNWTAVSDVLLEQMRKGEDIQKDLEIAIEDGEVDVNGIHVWRESTYNLLFHAIQWKNLGAVKSLLKMGVEVNWRNNRGSSALQLGVKSGDELILDALLTHGARVNAANHLGMSALHVATKENQVGMAATLIANGSDTNLQMSSGWTPLHNAVMSDNLEMIQLLLQNRARINIEATNRSICKDGTRMNVSKLAEIRGLDHVISLLTTSSQEDSGHKARECPQKEGGGEDRNNEVEEEEDWRSHVESMD